MKLPHFDPVKEVQKINFDGYDWINFMAGNAHMSLWLATGVTSQMASVRVDNLSRPGAADFDVSDKWIVLIHGVAPNSLVTNTAKRNDLGWSKTPYGYTDANGDFYLIGSMGPGDIGTWTEIWRAGGVEVPPTLTIPVLASQYPSVTEEPIPIVEEK